MNKQEILELLLEIETQLSRAQNSNLAQAWVSIQLARVDINRLIDTIKDPN